MAQHCERRTVESQQRRLVDAAERVGEQRGPEPAQVQHDRRLLRRSRHFSGDVDRALRIGAQVKRGGERARQRMRIEILRIVRAGVRFPRPLPGAECALQLGGHDDVGAARPLQVALHLIFGIVRAQRQQTLGERTRHRGVRARAQRAALAHRCNQRARVEVALRHQHAERVADRESDQRSFVARRRVELCNRARARLAPSQHEVDLLGRFRNRRPAARTRALLPQHLQTLVGLLVRQSAANEMATDGGSGAADARTAVQVHALARAQLAVDQVENSRHVRRGVGHAVIEHRQAPIAHAPLGQLGQQGPVLGELALLREIDEAGDARGQQPLHALHGVGARHRAGVFPGEKPARLHPVAVGNRCARGP